MKLAFPSLEKNPCLITIRAPWLIKEIESGKSHFAVWEYQTNSINADVMDQYSRVDVYTCTGEFIKTFSIEEAKDLLSKPGKKCSHGDQIFWVY